jgi:5-methylcytosine-specific restriction endonuclease McrA
MTPEDTVLHDPGTAWRAIVLYGQNTATYKIALARCIERFVQEGRAQISLPHLADTFFDLYVERLQSGKPQLVLPGRLTVMERIVALYEKDVIARDEAIARVAQQAFGDVVPRFHTVFDRPVPVPFYEPTADGALVLTDAAFAVFARPDAKQLGSELDARWDLLEAAFALKREPGHLANDVRMVYLHLGYERTSVTHLTPVLHGYQQGRCFYCAEPIPAGDGHVDHVIPRQFVQHDAVWNLVLAHGFCNQHKSDQLPGPNFVQQLVERNEHLIASNHPLRQDIMAKLGATLEQRRKSVMRVYDDAQVAIPYTWSGLRGYEPATSSFYRDIIRSLAR